MIECIICKAELNSIGWKHCLSHDLTVAEYKLQYPDAPLASEETLKKRASAGISRNASRKGVPRTSAVIDKMKQTKAANPLPAWNKGVPMTPEAKLHLSTVRTGLYASGDISHWNLGNTTPTEVKDKISTTAKGQHRHYAEISKEKRNVTVQQKIKAGWIKTTSYRMTDAHKASLLSYGHAQRTLAIHKAVTHAKDVCVEHNITCSQLSHNSYLFHLICNKCATEYTRTKNSFIQSKIHQQSYLCPSCHPRATIVSAGEASLSQYIASVTTERIVLNDRITLSGREIDCLIPSMKIGFEYTGLYWHAEAVSNRAHHDHNWKTNLAASRGVRLITIFEDEWLNTPDIVKSRINHLLGKVGGSKIYARKTTVSRISNAEKAAFLIQHHIQGNDVSGIRYGAWYGTELIGVMTFTKTNFTKGGNTESYELNRFAVKQDTHSPGLASKMFSAFVREYQPHHVISYADRRWSTGNVYNQIGFDFVESTPVSYWYLLNNYTKRVHRSSFMKHMLVDKLEVFNPALTEWENMKLSGYDRIWDCGTDKYEYIGVYPVKEG